MGIYLVVSVNQAEASRLTVSDSERLKQLRRESGKIASRLLMTRPKIQNKHWLFNLPVLESLLEIGPNNW